MIILITPYKFTEFSFINYEIDIYKKKLKHKIEIHDLSNLVNPTWKDAFKLKKYKKSKIFKSINDWENHLIKLKDSEKKIIVINELDINSLQSLQALRKLNKYFKKIVRIKAQGIPMINQEKKIKIDFSWIKKKLSSIISHPKYLMFFIKKTFFKLLSKLIVFDEIYVLKSGKKINFLVDLKAKKTFFINCHYRDYSRYISMPKKIINYKKPYAVYLDTPGPYFKDDFSLFEKKIKYNVAQWYNDLNNFLLEIEKIYFCKVIIIPHPKVKSVYNPYYHKHFKICHDLDAVHNLIPNSKFVMSINASTAIGLAIARNKPVILMYNNQQKILNNPLFNEIKFISKKINSSLININKYKKEFLLNELNKKKYKDFFYNYISSKDISKLKNYEILENIFKKV